MIPTKLRDDAIVEAVCQVQFDAPSDVAEVVVGRLGDYGRPGQFRTARLPAADVPPTIRRVDPNFKYQPILELNDGQGQLIRIGENVISLHMVGANKYPGWDVFKESLAEMLKSLYEKVKDVRIEGATLRYINAIVPKRHHIDDVHALSLSVVVGGEAFRGPLNLNYTTSDESGHVITTRIAHTSFVQGFLPDGAVAVIDVEVSSTPGIKAAGIESVESWFAVAHDLEKKAFFRLVPKEALEKLDGSKEC